MSEELVDITINIYRQDLGVDAPLEQLRFTRLPMARVKDAIDLLNDDHVELIPAPRTQDFTIDELFKQGFDIANYTVTCSECACEVKTQRQYVKQHTEWHNKLLP